MTPKLTPSSLGVLQERGYSEALGGGPIAKLRHGADDAEHGASAMLMAAGL